MKKIILLIPLLMFLPEYVEAQAKKPTLMVFPADVWMNQHGYVQAVETQGRTRQIPDYEKAFQNDRAVNNVVAKIGEMMTERGMNLESVAETLRQLEQTALEDEFLVSNESGASLAENTYDKLLNTVKSDIRIYVDWNINTVGPRRSVTYTLTGRDAYTGKQVANASGTGAASYAAEEAVLLEEAVLEHMDQFVSQLQMHFDDLLANGREVSVSVRVFDNGSGLSLEEEYDGYELSEIIENWMHENTVNHRFSTKTTTSNRIDFNQVRIPLYDERGRAMDAKRFVSGLRKYLRAEPYKIVSKDSSRGLGFGILVLGEK
ncbi:MAG: hypothetical protein IJY31_04725 [Muribaculaceae bacterium]|nr:hypothetical protein [Muribaculaceae bacterium]